MMDKRALKILLVDDDEDLLDLLEYNLQKQGFQVKTVSEMKQAIVAAQTFQPELIVLDVIMPDGNGFDLCKNLRGIDQFKDTLTFFLSAKSETAWRDRALQIGADDFIEKLSGIRVLTNRVNAVLRQNLVIRKGVETLAVNDLVVDRIDKTAYIRGREASLSAPEFEILFFFMQNANHIISVENLTKIIWGSEIYRMNSSVERCLANLQHKIGAAYIEIICPGYYRFNGPR